MVSIDSKKCKESEILRDRLEKKEKTVYNNKK